MVVILLLAVITQEAKAKPGWSGGGGGSCGRGGCGGGGGSNCGSRGCGGGSNDKKNSTIQTPKLLIVPLILLQFQEAEEVIVVEEVLEDLAVAAEAVEVAAQMVCQEMTTLKVFYMSRIFLLKI